MLPEKPVNPPWVFRSTIHWSFRVLVLAFVVGLMIFWGIDGFSVSDFHNDFVTRFDSKVVNNFTHPDSTPYNNNNNNNNISISPLKQFNNFTIQKTTAVTQLEFAGDSTKPMNYTGKAPDPVSLKWVSAELDSDYSSNLLAQWLAPGGEPCKDSTTDDIFIQGLDNLNRDIELSTGDIHEYVIQTLDSSGNQRCLGGDYFETDLSGDSWKSRPPIKDYSNGSYSFFLQVHPDFAGEYNLTIILLFRHYQGLKFSPERFAFDKVLRVVRISFKRANGSARLPEIKQCKKSDYNRDVWAGRWTRHGKNDDCQISNDGRYRCLKPNYPCKHPWCYGPLGSVESNGWVYSAHCSFRVYDSESAWNCLNNRWLFFWGDSNHCDTIHNMLNFVLNFETGIIPRLFDMNITNPSNSSQSVRITSVFNGHYNHTGNYQGLNSLYNEGYREYMKKYFSGETVPDTLIMNSGLHDGVYWPNLRRFIKGAEDAAAFWAEVLDGVRRRKVAVPVVIYRTTVATGGYARRLVFNPNKMEAFNGVFVDKLRQLGLIDHVIDHFDMTYPWHYDNRCNDGVHYGRAPAKMRWRDGEIGHQYFVDLMLCHVLLNVLCST